MMGLLDLGCSCIVDSSPLPNLFSLAPVDWTARSVIHLAKTANYGIFHITNPNFTTLLSLTSFLNLPSISTNDFVSKVNDIESGHPLYAWKDILTGTGFTHVEENAYPLMEKTLKQLKEPAPTIDQNFVNLMVEFLRIKKI